MDRRYQGEKLEKKQSSCSPYINAGVELLSLVDDTLMRKFRRENSNNESVAWQKMTEYFAFVVNGVSDYTRSCTVLINLTKTFTTMLH